MKKIINTLKPTAPLETLAWLRFHTTFSLHMRAHKLGWYREWHGFRFHQHAHALVLAVYIIGIFTASLGMFMATPSKTHAANEVTWDMNTSSEYTYDSNKIEFTGGVARLKWQGSSYPTDNPTVVGNISHKYNIIYPLYAYCNGSQWCNPDSSNVIQFQVSNNNGATWYWYSGGWQIATGGYAQSNSADTIRNNIYSFSGTLGGGTHDFKWRAYLHSHWGTGTPNMDYFKIWVRDTLPSDNIASVNGFKPGWTFQNSETSASLLGIHFTDASTGYAVGGNGVILKTANGGTTWTPQTSGTGVILNSVHFTDASTGYAVGGNGVILKTANGGTTWTPQIRNTVQPLSSVYFTDINTGYAVGAQGTILKNVNGDEGTQINSGEWHNSSNPHFSWSAPNDNADTANGETVSGIYYYYGCFSIDSNCSPGNNPGYFGSNPSNKSFNLNDFMPNNIEPLVSGQTYYIRTKTLDNENNYSAASQVLFTYKYDADKPTNPSVERNPVGWSSTNSFAFTFSGASDTGGSGLKGYEYKRETDSSWTYTANASVSGIQAYQNGVNVFQVRALDNAGNTADGYTSVNYYYSGSAPSAPQNLAVTPNNNTQNSFNFTWQTPATYDDAIKGYRWSVNAVPSSSNTVYTTETTTGAMPAATQQGLNTFYVVAIDSTDKVNYSNYASVQFEAATAAPGTPLAPVISDISNRNATPAKWGLALSWNAPVSGGTIDHYIIQRSTDQDNWTQVGTATSRAFAGSGLNNSTVYYYRIIATDNAGSQSAPSSVVSKQPTGKYAAHPDIRPPSMRVASTTATITWSTDRASSSFIQYGKTFTYGASNGSPDSTTTHTVTLNGLEPGTTYNFRQQSYDENRDYTADSAVSQNYTFTTLPPPGISDVKFSDISLSSAIVTWKTTSSATSSFWYGKTNSYGKEYSDTSGSSTTNHTAKITNLDHSSTYHLKMFATDIDGNTMQSDDYTFDTLTMPKISNLKVEQMKGNRATLKATWDSNVPTSSSVEYTEGTGGKTLEITKSDLVLKHEVIVDRLKDDTEYNLTIIGRDAYGNEGNSETRRVRTAVDTTPPEISEITTETSINGYGKNAKSQMVVSWYTDEPSTSQVEYAKGIAGDSYSMSTQVDMSLVTSHVVVVSDLDPSSSYYFRVVSKDKSANEAKSEAGSSLTEQARASILDIIIQSFQSTLGWLFGGGKS